MGYVYIGELPSSSLKVAQLIRLTSASVAPMPWLIVLVRFSRCEVLAPLNPSGAARKPSGAPRKPSGAPPNRQGKWENLRRTSENLRPIAAKSAGYSSLPRVPRFFVSICGGSEHMLHDRCRKIPRKEPIPTHQNDASVASWRVDRDMY